MKITKIFLTTYAEKKWLESQHGFELTKREGFGYTLEKTDEDVFYRYVFLKNGRKSFLELDYKSKDKNAQAIYGNGFVALFKKYGEKPSILPTEQLKLNYLRHRQRRITTAICLLAAALCAAAVGRILAPLWLLSALFIAVSVVYLIDARATEKMIKEL